MAATDRGQTVEVDVGECRCPGAPHASDTVTLRARPNTTMRFALLQAINEASDDTNILTGEMVSLYLRLGPVAWNISNGNGSPVPIEDLADTLGLDREIIVANRASDLYTEAILGPLAPSASNSPEPTPKEPSTSPTSPTAPSSAPSSRKKRARGT